MQGNARECKDLENAFFLSRPDGGLAARPGATWRNVLAVSRPPSAKAAYPPAQRGATERNGFATPGEIASDAAESHKMQHLKIEFSAKPTGDAAQSNKLQHFKNDLTACETPHDTTAESRIQQNATPESVPSRRNGFASPPAME
jgi:hypothetical protein